MSLPRMQRDLSRISSEECAHSFGSTDAHLPPLLPFSKGVKGWLQFPFTNLNRFALCLDGYIVSKHWSDDVWVKLFIYVVDEN